MTSEMNKFLLDPIDSDPRTETCELIYTSSINHIKASTWNIRQSFVTIHQNVNFLICCQKNQNDNTMQLNSQLITTTRLPFLYCLVIDLLCTYTTIRFQLCRNCSKKPDVHCPCNYHDWPKT